MSATTFMLLFAGVAAPWLVAMMRRRSWSSDLVVVVAGVFSLACFVFGQFADGVLHWPLPPDFWLGLAAAFGLNQGGYYAIKKVAPNALQRVEEL